MANRWPETTHVALFLLAICAGGGVTEAVGQAPQPPSPAKLIPDAQPNMEALPRWGSRFRWDVNPGDLDSRRLWRLGTMATHSATDDESVKPAVHQLLTTASNSVAPIPAQTQPGAAATVAHQSTPTTRVIVAPPFAAPEDEVVFEMVDLENINFDAVEFDQLESETTDSGTAYREIRGPQQSGPETVDTDPNLMGSATADTHATQGDAPQVKATAFQPVGEAWKEEEETWEYADAELIADPADVGSGLQVEDGQVVSQPSNHARPRILFQPAVPTTNAMGQAVLRPTVRLADVPEGEILSTPGTLEMMGPAAASMWGDGRIPLEQPDVSGTLAQRDDSSQVWLPSGIGVRAAELWDHRPRLLSQWVHRASVALNRQSGYDVGVGRERLPFALFEIESAQPLNNFRMRFESARDLEFPDRAEYFWSKIDGKGPGGENTFEPSVDYQTIRMLLEVGTPRLSVGTEIPLVFIDPTVVGNTAGLGDMVLTTKTLMIDGDTFQLTQLLKTQMPTGTPKVGRGNGHTSMETGLIASYKWSEDTLLHGVLDLWFPLGGDPDFSGEVLRYGFGCANVFYDSDSFAVIPTFEMVFWSVLSGQKTGSTVLGTPFDQRIDNENIINLYPGVRLVRDQGGDLGLFELGLNGGVSVSERHWYRGILRLDLRWSF